MQKYSTSTLSLYSIHLKQIFKNILLLYRNFFHWNISKICIFLYANIVGFIASIPFIGIIIYQYFSTYSTLGISISAESFLLNNMSALIITAILLLCIVTIFICTYTYGNFLLQNVYKSYLVGERLPYTKNLYFSLKHFRAYIGILGWIGLYLLAPVIIGLVLIIPFGIFAKLSLGLSTLIVGGVSLVIFIALLIWCVHLMIRLIFSYYTLLYSEKIEKAKTYIDESFRLTRKKVWKIIFLILPFLIILGVAASMLQVGEEKLSESRAYTALLAIQKQSGQDDHKLLEGFFAGNDDDRIDFGSIEKAFTPMKDDINRDFLSASMQYIDAQSIDPRSWIFTSIFVLFSFLIFEGLTSMFYLSVYQIIRAKDTENNWDASMK